jgi:serum/glucocorticoid-regulated kinase 2
MQTGLPPFHDVNVNLMYQRILTDPLNFPLDLPGEAWGVMTGLLQRDPTRRLGVINNGGKEVKRHLFFAKHIDWNRCVTEGRWYCKDVSN